MSNAYLDIAENVLKHARQPMTASEILNSAYLNRCVPAHLYGRTQEKTLQARISEDIIRLETQSAFYRTSRARFFLRLFLGDPTIPASFKREYFALRRRRSSARDHVLTFESACDFFPGHIIDKEVLDQVFLDQRYRYMTLSQLRVAGNALPVCAYAVFHHGGEFLSYQGSQFIEEIHPTRGYRSFGFGSAVKIEDGDLLYDAYHGILGNAVAELTYTLGASAELARRARYGNSMRLWGALVTRNIRGLSFLRPVLSFDVGEEFHLGKKALSVSRVVWLTPAGAASVPDADEVSSTLLSTGLLEKILQS